MTDQNAPQNAVEPEPAHRLEADPTAARQERDAARKQMSQRERERFGGVKVGCAFFGWLAATGLAVILIAVVTAAGVGIAGRRMPNPRAGSARSCCWWCCCSPTTAAVTSPAGWRVSNGLRQGSPSAWAIVFAIVVAVVGAFGGAGSGLLGVVSGFPRIPLDAGDETVAAIVTALAAAAVTLVGAMLGGLAGMRFHRRVDRAALAEV